MAEAAELFDLRATFVQSSHPNIKHSSCWRKLRILGLGMALKSLAEKILPLMRLAPHAVNAEVMAAAARLCVLSKAAECHTNDWKLVVNMNTICRRSSYRSMTCK